MKMRITCAMIDASMFSLLQNQGLRGEPLQANCPMLPAQQHSPELERTQNCTHCSALPHATRKPPKAHAPLILTLMLNKACAKAAPTKPGRPPASGGRPAPPQRASGSALHLAHSCHKSRSHPTQVNHDMLQIHVMLRRSGRPAPPCTSLAPATRLAHIQ